MMFYKVYRYYLMNKGVSDFFDTLFYFVFLKEMQYTKVYRLRVIAIYFYLTISKVQEH